MTTLVEAFEAKHYPIDAPEDKLKRLNTVSG